MYGILDHTSRRLLALLPEVEARKDQPKLEAAQNAVVAVHVTAFLRVGPYARDPIFAVRNEETARTLVRSGHATDRPDGAGTIFRLDDALDRKKLEVVDLGSQAGAGRAA